MGMDIFNIVGSALDAQNARMGAIASNLANADAVAPPGAQPYRASEVVFATTPVSDGEGGADADPADATGTNLGVQVLGTVQSNAPPKSKYDPSNPYAGSSGYTTGSNVSSVDEMVNLIDSSNSYSASIAVLQQTSRIDTQLLASFQVA
jgi:flagellar basal-body rod protein FlgC